MLKEAYHRGVQEAFEKNAFVGSLLGRGAAALGRGLWGAGKLLGRGAARALPGGRETLMYGGISGGLGALTADPGERLEGLLKGFGTGLIGGAGWHYGTRGMGGLMKRLARSGTLARRTPGLAGSMQQAMGIGKFKGAGPVGWGELLGAQRYAPGEAARLFGAKALVGVPTLAGAYGASMAAEQAAQKYVPQLQQPYMERYQGVPKYVGIARDVLRAPRLGLTPPGGFMGTSSGATSGARTW